MARCIVGVDEVRQLLILIYFLRKTCLIKMDRDYRNGMGRGMGEKKKGVESAYLKKKTTMYV